MSLPVRVGTLLVAFLAVVGGAIFVVIHFFLAGPPVIDFTSGAGSGQPVNVVLQEDPQNHGTATPGLGVVLHPGSEDQAVGAHHAVQGAGGARVNVTILGYDGCTPLRNPFWGKVTGTIGNTETVDGKTVSVARLLADLLGGAYVLHPLHQPQRADGLADDRRGEQQPVRHVAVHVRAARDDEVQLHRAQDARRPTSGQCRVPCGGGYVTGFGGPMQTFGFMTGQMEVAS